MTLESMTHDIYLWVSRYLPVFCLISIACWTTCVYLWGQDWQRRVRDSLSCFVMIGVLAGMLAVKPYQSDALIWPPLTWFCFTLLMVLELLWIAYLLEAVVLYLRGMLSPTAPPRQGKVAPTHYHFPSI